MTTEHNLTPEEIEELRGLHGKLPHQMTDDQRRRRGELWARASEDDMVAVMPPSEPTSKVLGHLIHTEEHGYLLLANSAHYADDRHHVWIDDPGSYIPGKEDNNAYRIPDDLQKRAAHLHQAGEQPHWQWARVQNSRLGSPAGPILYFEDGL